MASTKYKAFGIFSKPLERHKKEKEDWRMMKTLFCCLGLFAFFILFFFNFFVAGWGWKQRSRRRKEKGSGGEKKERQICQCPDDKRLDR